MIWGGKKKCNSIEYGNDISLIALILCIFSVNYFFDLSVNMFCIRYIQCETNVIISNSLPPVLLFRHVMVMCITWQTKMYYNKKEVGLRLWNMEVDGT